MDYQNQSHIKIGALQYGRAGFFATCGLLSLLTLPASAQVPMQQPAVAPVQLAQNYPPQQKRRTLFDMLFGNSRQPAQQQYIEPPQQQQPPRRTTAPVKKKPVIAKPKSVIATPAQPPQPEAVAKNPDAEKVLVLGDFSAGWLAEGLSETFAQVPDLQIINRTNGSSGFVRQDYYNWSQELPAILAEQKPAVIVMMIGANDRQSLTEKSSVVTPDTDAWKKLYQSRVDAFLEATVKSGVPVVWIGQPPYQSSALSQTMLSLNAISKIAASQAGSLTAAPNAGTTAETALPNASFVDVWDGFVDDKGGFTQTGVDVNGQTVRLRGNDGITMTSAGKRKLAFYAEKPLRQLLKLTSPDSSPAPDSSSNDSKTNERMALPVHKEITRIGPMKLSDLDQSGDENLLGDTAIARKSVPKRTGNPQIPQGRADDFRWPRP